MWDTVKTVYSAAAQPGENPPEPRPIDTQPKSKNDGQPQVWDPQVNTDHLTEAQQEATKQMLREECQAFAFDEDDVGCIPSIKMHITLHDTSPVQKTYMYVPKSLHKEVKEYLQDLLNRGWVTFRSRSPYSSPGVCVQKKDGSLRLCRVVPCRVLQRTESKVSP